MSTTTIVLACLVLMCGAAVQGAVGFGVNLFAAPILLLLDPALVPVPMILAALALNVLVTRREHGDAHWEMVRWPLVGVVPGSVLGALLVRWLGGNPDALALFFGGLILLAVALSFAGLHPRPTEPALAGAGFASGFMGTAIGIGGPPIAMMFQHRSGPELRGGLARFFTVGSVVSIVILAVVGRVGLDDLRTGALLLPGIVVGYLASSWIAGRVDAGHVRVAVLSLSAVSALVSMGQATSHLVNR